MKRAESLLQNCRAFFKAVRCLEKALSAGTEIGAALSPARERIRFTARKGRAFPAADISEITYGEDGAAQVEVAFMGLVGPSGVLPHWYHELVLEREKSGDHAMGDFYDLFHHRLISIFYRAWKRNALLPQKKSDNSDLFSNHLFSFLGLATEGLREKLAVTEAALLHFCGQASRQVASASTIAQVVQHVLGVDAEIEQFVPRTVYLEPADLTMLGQNNCLLGVDTVCGSQTCDVQSTFRLSLGPMGYQQFIELSPGRGLEHLVSLVRFLAGPEYEFEIGLILRRDEVPGCRLGEATPDAPRLGRSTWLKAPDSVLDADPYVTVAG
ncbi:type VI secretion system baseplate subunit TssG [Geomonas anaerohicana]|uniref:Type VI secretion system baseplate subunit TssG n=1 Tax=Geomonas anaerohicana TaxID=2798583 RepID=A0ABS0YEH1_9BACT|nr:type VI secretion system baseplate subunit TssG [Geomonas anaerohicana]MBJ6750702.1 type VI secretion system baseplate subunit TssG [Geomonas anaerohicana]